MVPGQRRSRRFITELLPIRPPRRSPARHHSRDPRRATLVPIGRWSTAVGRMTPSSATSRTSSGESPLASARSSGNRRRARRQPLVHGELREQDRPHHARGSLHRVPVPHGGQPALGHHRGPRRQPLVHRAHRQQGRPDHDRRRHHRVPDRDGRAPSPQGITTGPDGNLWFTENGEQPDRTNRRRPATTTASRSPPRPRSPRASSPAPTATSGSPRTAANKIGRITTAGVVTEFPLPEPDPRVPASPPAPTATSGSPSFDGNKIGRITPAGVITEFLHPDRRLRPLRHHAGPRRPPLVHRVPRRPRSGSSSSEGRRRPRSTSSSRSAVATFPRRSRPGDRMETLVHGSHEPSRADDAGRRGHGFSDPDRGRRRRRASRRARRQPLVHREQGNKIGRITPAGSITEFPVPTATGVPDRHHRRPRRRPLVHRSTRQQDRPHHDRGRHHRVPADRRRSAAGHHAPGPDGNLWFTEYGENQIGRITTAGESRRVPHPDRRTPTPKASRPAPTATSGSPRTTATRSDASRPTATSPNSRCPMAGARLPHRRPDPTATCGSPSSTTTRSGGSTTAGVLKEFLIPTADSGAYGITAGPDGHLVVLRVQGAEIGAVGIGDPTLDGVRSHADLGAGRGRNGGHAERAGGFRRMRRSSRA